MATPLKHMEKRQVLVATECMLLFPAKCIPTTVCHVKETYRTMNLVVWESCGRAEEHCWYILTWKPWLSRWDEDAGWSEVWCEGDSDVSELSERVAVRVGL